jgi:hypothetical protein
MAGELDVGVSMSSLFSLSLNVAGVGVMAVVDVVAAGIDVVVVGCTGPFFVSS